MTDPNSKSPDDFQPCLSDSPDTTIIYDDGDGDTTVRPIPPELLAQAIAQRDLIAKCLAERKQQREASGK
jgi:hypothetical protein